MYYFKDKIICLCLQKIGRKHNGCFLFHVEAFEWSFILFCSKFVFQVFKGASNAPFFEALCQGCFKLGIIPIVNNVLKIVISFISLKIVGFFQFWGLATHMLMMMVFPFLEDLWVHEI